MASNGTWTIYDGIDPYFCAYSSVVRGFHVSKELDSRGSFSTAETWQRCSSVVTYAVSILKDDLIVGNYQGTIHNLLAFYCKR